MENTNKNRRRRIFYVLFSSVIFLSILASFVIGQVINLPVVRPISPPCMDCVPWVAAPTQIPANVPTSAVSYVGVSVPRNPGHSSDQVFINYSGKYVSLQTAIDKGFLFGVSPSSSDYQSLPKTSPYEMASQVIVTVGGYNITLQKAIENNFLSSTTLNPQSYAVNGIPAGDNYAGSINVINTSGKQKTLQRTIDSDLLGACSGPVGASCSPSGQTCTTPGTTQCDGSCTGASGCCSLNQGNSCSITCQSCACGVTCICSTYFLSGGTTQCDGSCGGISCPPANPFPYAR